MFILTLIAQVDPISNWVLPSGYGGNANGDGVSAFTNYVVLLWRTLIIVGGMATIVFLLWGAIDWIMSAGDEGKVSSARHKMTGAVVGLAILAASVAIVDLIGTLLGIDLLKVCIPSPNGTCP